MTIHTGKIEYIRDRRAKECFPVINRGEFWYDSLTPDQKVELKKWYLDWLDATETLIMPKKPEWLK